MAEFLYFKNPVLNHKLTYLPFFFFMDLKLITSCLGKMRSHFECRDLKRNSVICDTYHSNPSGKHPRR